MDLPQAVRALRAFTKESQQSLGQRLGLSLRTIANYEQGRTPNSPALYRLAQLAREVGRLDLAEVFSQTLAEELHYRVEPMTAAEKAWSDATLALLRFPDLSGWPRIARVMLGGLEKLVQHRPDDEKLAGILLEARYRLTGSAEESLQQLARERQRQTGKAYAQVYAEVLREHPELYDQYQRERYDAARGTTHQSKMARPFKPKKGR
jgi:transcriptional regulator with XRE-family HTH domain